MATTTKTKKVKTISITSKNVNTKAVKELSLNDFVFYAAPKMENADIIKLLNKQGRKFSIRSLQWYASKARAGVRR